MEKKIEKTLLSVCCTAPVETSGVAGINICHTCCKCESPCSVVEAVAKASSKCCRAPVLIGKDKKTYCRKCGMPCGFIGGR